MGGGGRREEEEEEKASLHTWEQKFGGERTSKCLSLLYIWKSFLPPKSFSPSSLTTMSLLPPFSPRALYFPFLWHPFLGCSFHPFYSLATSHRYQLSPELGTCQSCWRRQPVEKALFTATEYPGSSPIFPSPALSAHCHWASLARALLLAPTLLPKKL